MKLALFSKTKADDQFKKEIENYGFKYSENNPDIVISLGGDGTYLRSERKFSGIPKLIVRYNSICKKSEINNLNKALKKLKKGKYKIKNNIKLETKIRRKKIGFRTARSRGFKVYHRCDELQKIFGRCDGKGKRPLAERFRIYPGGGRF